MAETKQTINEINMELVGKCLKRLEELLNISNRKGAFDISEAHSACECFVAVVEAVKHCELLQKTIKTLAHTQELVQKANDMQADAQPKIV